MQHDGDSDTEEYDTDDEYWSTNLLKAIFEAVPSRTRVKFRLEKLKFLNSDIFILFTFNTSLLLVTLFVFKFLVTINNALLLVPRFQPL